jgi:polyisoprenoid-binding protein YceI
MSTVNYLSPLFALAMGLGSLTAADTYQLDPVHTAANFRVKHVNVSYTYGRFNDITGTLLWDAANPAASKIEVTIQTGSVDTHNEKRDGHLASPDFFDAKQFSTMTFVSTAFSKNADETYAITGNFTLHGVTKPMTITATKTGEGKDPWGGYRIGFESTFVIKRSDFGMSKMIESVGDEVTISFTAEGIKK